eukprot:2386689-Rhodomonas_salina.1
MSARMMRSNHFHSIAAMHPRRTQLPSPNNHRLRAPYTPGSGHCLSTSFKTSLRRCRCCRIEAIEVRVAWLAMLVRLTSLLKTGCSGKSSTDAVTPEDRRATGNGLESGLGSNLRLPIGLESVCADRRPGSELTPNRLDRVWAGLACH